MNPDDVKNEAPVAEPTPPVEAPPVLPVEPKPGEKTDPALLLKSLQEERELRRKERENNERLERELQALKDAAGNTGEPLSEEGQTLQRQIDSLKGQLATTENTKRLDALKSSFPALKDKATEFDTYRADPVNKGMSLETAAKAFLAENELLVPTPTRKGLEEGSGGAHTPPKQGKSPEEIDDLRKNNYREYKRQLLAGDLSL